MRILLVTHRYPPLGVTGVGATVRADGAGPDRRGARGDGADAETTHRPRRSRRSRADRAARRQRRDHRWRRLVDRIVSRGIAPRLERLFERTLLEVDPDVVLISHLINHSPTYVSHRRRAGACRWCWSCMTSTSRANERICSGSRASCAMVPREGEPAPRTASRRIHRAPRTLGAAIAPVPPRARAGRRPDLPLKVRRRITSVGDLSATDAAAARDRQRRRCRSALTGLRQSAGPAAPRLRRGHRGAQGDRTSCSRPCAWLACRASG